MFVDSSYWIAITDRRDQWHERAKSISGRVGRAPTVLDLAASEALTIVGSRLGGKAANQLFEYFLDSCRILHMSDELFESAMRRHLSFDGELSMTDCATIEAMVRASDREVLSFDSDFDRVKGLKRTH